MDFGANLDRVSKQLLNFALEAEEIQTVVSAVDTLGHGSKVVPRNDPNPVVEPPR